LLRNNNKSTQSIYTFCRGAKKKKEESVAAETNDIINIFKEKTDPELKSMAEYPPWLTELSVNRKNFHQFVDSYLYGSEFDRPNMAQKRSFLGLVKKKKLKDLNTEMKIKTMGPDDESPRDLEDEDLPSPISGADIEYVESIIAKRMAQEEVVDEDEEGKPKPKAQEQEAEAADDKKGAAGGKAEAAGKAPGGAKKK